MWRVFYGPDLLYDPRDQDLAITEAKGEVALNEAGGFEFVLPPTHPLAGRIECLQKDVEIVVEQDGEKVFCGRVMTEAPDFHRNVKYVCEGERAYLNDVTLPPYSTAGKDGMEKAPSEVDALFNWYISEYNAKVSPRHRFLVGTNEGASLDPNNHVLRESSQRPTVWAEIREKLVEKLGGWVRVRHEGGIRYIDYLADGGKACAQRIEFGVNLLDYARETRHDDYCTSVIPVGEDADGNEVTISSLPDGPMQAGYEKIGEAVVSLDGRKKYGTIEKTVAFDDATTPEYLLKAGLRNLVNRKVGDTLEIGAVDLHQVDPSIERISLGSYVRATSKPHGLDEYFLCMRLPFTIGDPGGCTYTLGNTYDVLTGRQSAKLSALNSSINKVYEAIPPIAQEAKDAARAAEEAKGKADAAKQAADGAVSDAAQAAEDALEAKSKADEATASASLVEGRVTEAKDAAEAAKRAADDAGAKAEEAKGAADAVKGSADEASAAAEAALSAAEKAAQDAMDALAASDGALASAGTAVATAGAAKEEAAGALAEASKVRGDLEGRIASVTETMTADYARKTELATTESSLKTEIEKSAAGLSSEVAQTYAKKTDLTAVESGLSTKIAQNAEGVASTAARVDAVDETANQAAAKAEEAGASATKAASEAAGAKAGADDAKAKAEAAGAAAGAAQTNAAAAKSAAEAAKKAADDAAANLAEAEKGLEDVKARADATDGQVAAAQAAVDAAKKAADSAASNASAAAQAASAAQTTANAAKANAATAQTTADAAKSGAAAAQSAAENAKKAADAAAAAAAALEKRVTAAETNITQNATAIELKANRTDVYAKGETYSKAQADAAIKVSADAIASTVSAVKQTADGLSTKVSTLEQTANGISVKLGTVEGTANAASSAAAAVKSDLAANYARKTLPDTRSANNNPQWYWTNYPRQIITEFKTASVIGLSGETYATLETTVPWNEKSGGWPKQAAKIAGKEYWRVGTSETAWSAWNDSLGLATTANSLAGTANSTANAAKTNAATAQTTANNAASAASTAQSTANAAKTNAATAQTTANTARTEAAAAAKTATNYMSYDASGGLQIGNKTSGAWSGFRTQITSAAFNVLNAAGTVLASYGANVIELGKNATSAVVKLCGGKGSVGYSQKSPLGEATPGLDVYTTGADGINVFAQGTGTARVVSNSGNLKAAGAVVVGNQYVNLGVGNGSSAEFGSGGMVSLGNGKLNIVVKAATFNGLPLYAGVGAAIKAWPNEITTSAGNTWARGTFATAEVHGTACQLASGAIKVLVAGTYIVFYKIMFFNNAAGDIMHYGVGTSASNILSRQQVRCAGTYDTLSMSEIVALGAGTTLYPFFKCEQGAPNKASDGCVSLVYIGG